LQHTYVEFADSCYIFAVVVRWVQDLLQQMHTKACLQELAVDFNCIPSSTVVWTGWSPPGALYYKVFKRVCTGLQAFELSLRLVNSVCTTHVQYCNMVVVAQVFLLAATGVYGNIDHSDSAVILTFYLSCG